VKALIGILLLFVCPLLAKEDRDWQVGKVLDSQSARTYVQSGTTTSTTTSGTLSPDYGAGSTLSANATAETRIHELAIQDTQILIVGKEYAYVVDDSVAKSVGLPTHGIVTRAILNRKHGCRFVIGDSIRYSQDKSKLYVLDPDGKTCKLDIVRQERLTD
jgi:hypothetical protein